MFVAIDPAGLEALATTLESASAELGRRGRVAVVVLVDRDSAAVGATIAAALERISRWTIDMVSNLRWRAAVIRAGQAMDIGDFGPAAAMFAAGQVLDVDTFAGNYLRWTGRLRQSDQLVRDTIDAIGSWLHQSIVDWDVTNADLQHILEALEALPAAELDRVIAGLTPRQLTRWIEEMGHGSNGFSRAEKQQVFAMLASKASGESLGMIHDAILSAPGAGENGVDFGTAIEHNAAAEAIVSFVTYVVGQDLAEQPYAGIAPALATGGLDTPAAIDTVVACILDLEGALAGIVVDDTIVAANGSAAGTDIHRTPLRTFAVAVTKGDDPELKARALAALVPLVGEGEGLGTLVADRSGTRPSRRFDPATEQMLNDARADLVADATRIILSDPDGIIRQLATSIDPEGTMTGDYMYQLVARERTDDLRRIVNALRGGNQVDPVRFAASGTDQDYPYPAAQNLAFIAASLSNALARYTDRAKANIDAISAAAAVAGVLIGPLAPATGMLGKLISGAISSGGDRLAGDLSAAGVKDGIDDGLANLVATVSAELRPQLPLETSTLDLGEALLMWDARYDVVRLN